MGVRQLVTYWTSNRTKAGLLSEAPQACIVAEPTELDVVVAHRGVLRFRVRTEGKACHASDPTQGVNAIYRMLPVVQHFQKLTHRLSTQASVDRLAGRPALSVGLIQGGTAVNIVPAECVIDVDRRLLPDESSGRVWEQIASELSQFPGVTCEKPWLETPALSDRLNHPLADKLIGTLQSFGLTSPQRLGVPYCTNASTIGSVGIPTVVFGPGSIAQAHTVDEYIEIEQLESAAEAYYQFCSTYAIHNRP
jgi:acetylornithine deacetylase